MDKSKKMLPIKFNKKILILVVFILVACIGYKSSDVLFGSDKLDKSAYTVMKYCKSINKISVKGEVKGENTVQVFSDVNLLIKETKADVGDRVMEGDVLAVLDVKSIEDKIKEMESSIETIDAGNLIEVENAKAAYDNALKLSYEENNSDIQNASSALEIAEVDYNNKKDLYEKNKTLFDNGAISEQALKECENAYKNAKSIYDKSVVLLDNIKEKVQLELTTAKNKYNAAVIKSNDKTKDITLENMKRDLGHDKVLAPASGIITKKNAQAGNNSNGTLFEIQNDNDTNVILKVKEVDIEKIQVNQNVEMKSDSTGDRIINGQVIDIRAVALSDDGNLFDLEENSDDKEAEYEVKVKVTDPDCKFRIGMKIQADIIIDEKDGAFVVPIESITKDKDDNDIVYVAEKTDKDYIVKSLVITKGTENDSKVEIFGDGIKEDIIILNSPASYEIGSKLNIKEGE